MQGSFRPVVVFFLVFRFMELIGTFSSSSERVKSSINSLTTFSLFFNFSFAASGGGVCTGESFGGADVVASSFILSDLEDSNWAFYFAFYFCFSFSSTTSLFPLYMMSSLGCMRTLACSYKVDINEGKNKLLVFLWAH